MFSWIAYPTNLFHVLRRLMKNLTPEQKARFESATTEEEKKAVAVQIVGEIFPELAYISEESP